MTGSACRTTSTTPGSSSVRWQAGAISVDWPLAAGATIGVLAHAGFDQVVVETVGVGQSEVEVMDLVDVVVLVVAPGWGDQIQADKAGVLEIADLVVVNKGDLGGADELRRALLAARPEYQTAWSRRPPPVRVWRSSSTPSSDAQSSVSWLRAACAAAKRAPSIRGGLQET